MKNNFSIRSIALQKKWFYIQFLSSFVLISILAVTAYGFIFPRYKKQLLDTADLAIVNSASFLEDLLEKHQYAATLMASDSKIIELISTDLDNISSEKQIEMIANYNYTFSYFSRIKDMYDLSSLDIYTANEYYFDNFSKEYYSSSDTSQKFHFLAINRTTYTPRFYVTPNPEKSDLYYLRYIPNPTNLSEYCGALCFRIPWEKINEIIPISALFTDSFSVIIDSNSNVLFYSESTPIDEAASFLPAAEQIVPSEDLTSITLENTNYVSTVTPLGDFDLRLVTFISENVLYAPYYNFRFVLLSVCVLAFFLSIFGSKIMSAMIMRRITLLMNSLKQASAGVFIPISTVGIEDDFAVSIQNYNKILKDLEELISMRQHDMEQLRNYEIRLLLEQINPHFLYNTLELLNSIAHKNKDTETSSIVQALANFYKLSLNSGQAITTLEHELNHIENYLFIQNKRFEHEILLIADIPDELLNVPVLSFLLQPIIENSIIHGFLPKGNFNSCEIVIVAYEEDEFLYVEITDNGCGIPAEKLGALLSPSNFALNNINNRIKLYYGNDCGLNIESEFSKYTTVKLKLKPSV